MKSAEYIDITDEEALPEAAKTSAAARTPATRKAATGRRTPAGKRAAPAKKTPAPKKSTGTSAAGDVLVDEQGRRTIVVRKQPVAKAGKQAVDQAKVKEPEPTVKKGRVRMRTQGDHWDFS